MLGSLTVAGHALLLQTIILERSDITQRFSAALVLGVLGIDL
jgi:hypothetical protein